MKNTFSILLASIIIGVSIVVSAYIIASTNRYKTFGRDQAFIFDQWDGTIFSLDGKQIGTLTEEK